MINFVPQQRSPVAKRIYYSRGEKNICRFFPLLVFRELTVKAERDLMKPFVMIMIVGDIMTRYASLPGVTLPKIQLNCFNWMMVTSSQLKFA